MERIDEGNNHYSITYGVDQNRVKSVLRTPAGETTRLYLPSYEEVTNPLGTTDKIHYLCGGAVMVESGGRVYDPMLGSFLSIDPYIQAPDNWLNYNRYLYCYGNPLIYTDPLGLFSNDSESGSLFFRVDAKLSIGLQVSTNIDVGLNVGFNFRPASITLLEISSIQKDNDTTPWQTQLNIAGQGGTSKVNSEYSIMGTGLQQSFVTDGTQNSSNVEESISLLGVTFYKGGGVSFKLDFGASMGLGVDFSIEFGKRNF